MSSSNGATISPGGVIIVQGGDVEIATHQSTSNLSSNKSESPEVIPVENKSPEKVKSPEPSGSGQTVGPETPSRKRPLDEDTDKWTEEVEEVTSEDASDPNDFWDDEPAPPPEDQVISYLQELDKGDVSSIVSPAKGSQDPKVLQGALVKLGEHVSSFQKCMISIVMKEATKRKELAREVSIATEMASSAMVAAHASKIAAASSMRNSTKYCLHLSGDDLPPKSEEGKKFPKTAAKGIIQHFLPSVTVDTDLISDAHYQGETNNWIVRFYRVGQDSLHEAVLNEARKIRPKGFRARVHQSPMDSGMYFLLRCLVGADEAKNIFTSRSGKPSVWLKTDSGERPVSFESEAEIRQAMSPKSLEEERHRISAKKALRTKICIEKESLKRSIKRSYGVGYDNEASTREISRGRGGEGKLRQVDKAGISIDRDNNIEGLPGWPSLGGRRGRGGTGRGNGRHARSKSSYRGNKGANFTHRGRGGLGHPSRGRGGHNQNFRGSFNSRGGPQNAKRGKLDLHQMMNNAK